MLALGEYLGSLPPVARDTFGRRSPHGKDGVLPSRVLRAGAGWQIDTGAATSTRQ